MELLVQEKARLAMENARLQRENKNLQELLQYHMVRVVRGCGGPAVVQHLLGVRSAAS